MKRLRRLFLARAAMMLLAALLGSATGAWAQDSDLGLITELPAVDSGEYTTWGTPQNPENFPQLVDGDTGTKYGIVNNDPWVEFHYETAFTPKGYALWTANDELGKRNPQSWVIKAKANQDDEWTTLADVDNSSGDKLPMANNTRTCFDLDNNTAYRYFRFEATRASNGQFQLAELQFFTALPSQFLQLVSISGLQSNYFLTGSAIPISYTVTDASGTPLTKDTHYTEELQRDGTTVTEVKELGTYTLTITAVSGSGYTGSKSVTFTVANFVEIGSGTSASNYTPFSTLYKHSITEQLYTAEEIGTAGTINSISFYYTGNAAKDFPITVYMMNTDAENLSTGISLADADEVFNGTLSVPAAEGWVTITLNTPFVYDGTSNLLIGFNKSTDDWFGGSTWRYTGVGNMARYSQNDSNPYDTSTVPGTATNYRPNIRIDITPGEVAICSMPDGFEATNVTISGATLTWSGGSVTYNVRYKKASDAEWIVAATNTNATTFDLTGLTPGTNYQAQVQSVCDADDVSAWKNIAFTTACGAITSFPWAETFESYGAGEFNNPCWVNERVQDGEGSSSLSVFKVYTYSNGNNTTHQLQLPDMSKGTLTKLVLPEMTLPGDNYEFVLDVYRSNSTYNDNYASEGIRVYASTDGEIEGATELAFIPRQYTVSSDAIPAEEATGWYTYELPIPMSGTCYIILRGESQYCSSTYMDNFTVKETPTCIKPTGLTASNPTAHGATLSWRVNDETQTTWEVQMATDNEFPDGEVQLIQNINNHEGYELSGLAPETTYYVRVRANCGEGDVSDWSNTASFTTTIPCPTPTGFAVDDLSGYTATLNWNGTSDSYTVSYRTAAYAEGIYEEFNNQGIPSGWTKYSGLVDEVIAGAALTQNTSGWNTTDKALGQYTMKLNIYGATCKHWLVTPEFNLSQNLSFDLALTDYNNADPIENDTLQADDRFAVLIYADEAWHILREWNNSGSEYVYNDIPNTGENVTIDLSAYYGQNVKIAFYGESTESNNGDNDLHIDNVVCGILHPAGEWKTVAVDEAPAILTDLTLETAYEAKVQGNCGDVDGWSEETGMITFTTLNTCPVPTDLTVDNDNVTATTADLSWHGSIDVDSYTVRYRVPEHIEGGFLEPFNAMNIPSGWTRYTGLVDTVMVNPSALKPATSGWSFGNYNGVFDSHARFNIYSSYQGWLVTPTFTLESSTFTFDLALTAYSGNNVPAPQTDGTDDKFIVLISTDNKETWTILRQWDNEEGSTYALNNITNTAEGEQVSIDLGSYIGQKVCIAFYGESTVSNADNNLHIDNVIFGDLTVVPDSEWQTEEATATNVTLTGLNPETTYEAQVKSDCSDPEEWSNVVTFTTPEATTQTNTYTLAQGWNWVSFNIDITLDDLKTALVDALGSSHDITINSQDGNTTYRRGRWIGNLGELYLNQMYMINVPEDCEIMLEGMPIDPAEHPVTISNEHDNWIGFPLNEPMTVSDAFANFAEDGDIIQSQTAFAVYTNGIWRGTLTTLEPGQGYMYHSAAPEYRELVFPELQGGDLQYTDETHWSEFNYHTYQLNSPVVATIQINGNFIASDGNWADLEIAAFVDDECRGHAFMADYWELGDPYPIVELPVYYTTVGETVTFKLYNHATGIQYDLCTPNIDIYTGEKYVEFYMWSGEFVNLNFLFEGFLELANDDSDKEEGEKNTDLISGDDGSPKDVMLADRTLYKDGAWNTLCLPFDVRNENLGVIYEDNPEVMELDVDGTYEDETGSHQTGLEGNTLYLYFKPVDLSPESDDMMVAGRPYLIKWDNVGETIENPVFSGVAINTDTYDVTSEDGTVTFKGTYGFLSFAEPDENILFLGDGNNVYYPEAGASLGAFRAYFQLNTSTPVRAFRMSFGDVKTQGIVSATLNDRGNDKLYMLDGRKLDKPVRKGLYIKNGKKVVIK